MPPQYLNHSPGNNATGIQRDTLIFFRVEDSDGLDTGKLDVKIEGINAVIDGVFQSGYAGTITDENATPTAISVVVNPDQDFSFSQVVNVASKIEDLLGTVGNDFYEFLTLANPDKTAPIVAADPHGGLFDSSPIAVTLTANEPSVVIHYTLDGTNPDLSSPVYSVPLSISDEGLTTLKFFGFDNGNNQDIIRTEEYTIDTEVPISTANPSGGNFFSTQQVVLECDDDTGTVFFTTNGVIPTTSSTIYTTPISIPDNQTTEIKFFCIDRAGNIESVNTEVYNIAIAKNNYIVKNVFVRHAYVRHELELSWEDMHPIYTDIIGYNVYRAHAEFTDEYRKLNNELITITQYLDKTLDTEIVSEDVSEQFRRTVNISREVNDSFSGNTFDITKWRETDLGEFLFQYDGVIFTDKTGLNQESKLTSKFKLQGDFDIQINFALTKWTLPTTTISSSILRVKVDDNNYIQIGRSRSQSSNVYSSNKFTNSNPDLPITTTTVDDTGVYRITRSGIIITVQFYDKGTDSFITLQTFNSFTEDLYVEIVGKSADVTVEMKWTDFVLTSGAPVIIEPRNQLLEYIIHTSKYPIVDSSGTNNPTDDISEVEVTIDGQQAAIKRVEGKEGNIFLETERCYDEVKKVFYEPPVPDEISTVLVTYKTKLHTTNIDLRKNYFYKVTTVTESDETDLGVLQPVHLQSEELTYIYAEAIRRNQWLREQGGERVILYVKKRAGEVCSCILEKVKRQSHRRASQDCETCFGSGFVGGFHGPFPIIIGNLTTEQRINQTERGLKLQYQIETWTGPFPLISQRDMIVRRNGDRCLVGPITPVDGPGGVITQQHFTIEVLDARDIRYTFQIQPLPHQFVPNTTGIDKPGTKVPEISSSSERESLRTGMEKDKTPHRNKSVDAQFTTSPRRGRSITFENKLF